MPGVLPGSRPLCPIDRQHLRVRRALVQLGLEGVCVPLDKPSQGIPVLHSCRTRPDLVPPHLTAHLSSVHLVNLRTVAPGRGGTSRRTTRRRGALRKARRGTGVRAPPPLRGRRPVPAPLPHARPAGRARGRLRSRTPPLRPGRRQFDARPASPPAGSAVPPPPSSRSARRGRRGPSRTAPGNSASLTARFRMRVRRPLVVEPLENPVELAGVEQTGDHLRHAVDAGIPNNQAVGAPEVTTPRSSPV